MKHIKKISTGAPRLGVMLELDDGSGKELPEELIFVMRLLGMSKDTLLSLLTKTPQVVR